MSRMWWKDEPGEKASAEVAQGLSPSKPERKEAPPPPTPEERECVNVGLQLVRDALNPFNPQLEAARKMRQRRSTAAALPRRAQRPWSTSSKGFGPLRNTHGVTLSLSLHEHRH